MLPVWETCSTVLSFHQNARNAYCTREYKFYSQPSRNLYKMSKTLFFFILAIKHSHTIASFKETLEEHIFFNLMYVINLYFYGFLFCFFYKFHIWSLHLVHYTFILYCVTVHTCILVYKITGLFLYHVFLYVLLIF